MTLTLSILAIVLFGSVHVIWGQMEESFLYAPRGIYISTRGHIWENNVLVSNDHRFSNNPPLIDPGFVHYNENPPNYLTSRNSKPSEGPFIFEWDHGDRLHAYDNPSQKVLDIMPPPYTQPGDIAYDLWVMRQKGQNLNK